MENEIIEQPPWPKYSGSTTTIDVIGTMYVDETQIPGYHVNATAPVPEWEHLKVTPNSPIRVFWGCETHFYVFVDEAEFLGTPANLDAAP
jgi:hypothetical protein